MRWTATLYLEPRSARHGIRVEDPIQLQSGESDRSWDAGLVELAQPEIRIVKFTNGLDANDPVNGNDIPVVAPGGEVTWTYKVTNTGTVNIPEGDISVTDNIIGAVTTVDKGGDATPAILEPNESWIYSAVGTALDLVSAPDAPNLLANACNNVSGSVPGSRAYTNLGTVTIRRCQTKTRRVTAIHRRTPVKSVSASSR